MKEPTKKQKQTKKIKPVVINDFFWFKEGKEKINTLIRQVPLRLNYYIAVGQKNQENYIYDSQGLHYTYKSFYTGEPWELRLDGKNYTLDLTMETIAEGILCDIGKPVSKICLSFNEENKIKIETENLEYVEYFNSPPPNSVFSKFKKLNSAPRRWMAHFTKVPKRTIHHIRELIEDYIDVARTGDKTGVIIKGLNSQSNVINFIFTTGMELFMYHFHFPNGEKENTIFTNFDILIEPTEIWRVLRIIESFIDDDTTIDINIVDENTAFFDFSMERAKLRLPVKISMKNDLIQKVNSFIDQQKTIKPAIINLTTEDIENFKKGLYTLEKLTYSPLITINLKPDRVLIFDKTNSCKFQFSPSPVMKSDLEKELGYADVWKENYPRKTGRYFYRIFYNYNQHGILKFSKYITGKLGILNFYASNSDDRWVNYFIAPCTG
jgi:hypothetical protein